jgi:hypothetical protein
MQLLSYLVWLIELQSATQQVIILGSFAISFFRAFAIASDVSATEFVTCKIHFRLIHT